MLYFVAYSGKADCISSQLGPLIVATHAMDSDADAVATFADVWARQVFPFIQDDYEELGD